VGQTFIPDGIVSRRTLLEMPEKVKIDPTLARMIQKVAPAVRRLARRAQAHFS
jgi:hypothetical protein